MGAAVLAAVVLLPSLLLQEFAHPPLIFPLEEDKEEEEEEEERPAKEAKPLRKDKKDENETHEPTSSLFGDDEKCVLRFNREETFMRIYTLFSASGGVFLSRRLRKVCLRI